MKTMRPKEPCRVRTCPEPAAEGKRGYCDKHSYLASRHNVRREQDSHKYYNTATWRSYSKGLREREHVCINHATCGGRAEVVDHIVAVEDGGEFWAPSNHQVMCHACHNRKRQQESFRTRGKNPHEKKMH